VTRSDKHPDFASLWQFGLHDSFDTFTFETSLITNRILHTAHVNSFISNKLALDRQCG